MSQRYRTRVHHLLADSRGTASTEQLILVVCVLIAAVLGSQAFGSKIVEVMLGPS